MPSERKPRGDRHESHPGHSPYHSPRSRSPTHRPDPRTTHPFSSCPYSRPGTPGPSHARQADDQCPRTPPTMPWPCSAAKNIKKYPTAATLIAPGVKSCHVVFFVCFYGVWPDVTERKPRGDRHECHPLPSPFPSLAALAPPTAPTQIPPALFLYALTPTRGLRAPHMQGRRKISALAHLSPCLGYAPQSKKSKNMPPQPW